MPDTNIIKDGKFALAIELSNPNALSDAHAVAVFSLACDQPMLVDSLPVPSTVRSADALMMLVETLCTKHHIAPRDIHRVVLSIGPGGYTSLRISSTTAKVLADTLGCELVAVPSALVASKSINPPQCPALIALASKNNQTHAAVLHVDGSLEVVGIIDASKIESLNLRSVVSDSHLPESFVESAHQLGIDIVPIELDARNVLDASVGIHPIDPSEIAPMYAREPDAITQWRTRNKS